MEVILRPSTEAASELTAKLIIDAVGDKPDIVLGLATGRTMESVYEKLVHAYDAGELDLSQCTTFNLDEYIGLAADNPQGYRMYMNTLLFNKTNINLDNTHLPDGMASNLKTESEHYYNN